MSQNNTNITYEIKYNNFNKIITGISLPIYGNVQIFTRNIKNVLEFGLSTE